MSGYQRSGSGSNHPYRPAILSRNQSHNLIASSARSTNGTSSIINQRQFFQTAQVQQSSRPSQAQPANFQPIDLAKLQRIQSNLPATDPDADVGSNTNPIRIIQQGDQYVTTQDLNDDQLKQIIQVLTNQALLDGSESRPSAIYNKKTNTRIVFRVTRARRRNPLPSEDQPEEGPGVRKKRRRSDAEDPDFEPGFADEEVLPFPIMRRSNISKRVIRPPKHLMQAYKHIPLEELSNDVREEDSDGGYSTYSKRKKKKTYAESEDDRNSWSPGSTDEDEDLPWRCDSCTRKFQSKMGLMRHQRVAHLAPKSGGATKVNSARKSTGGVAVTGDRGNHYLLSLKRRETLQEAINSATDDDLIAMVLPRLSKVVPLWDFLVMRSEKGDPPLPDIPALVMELVNLHETVSAFLAEHLHLETKEEHNIKDQDENAPNDTFASSLPDLDTLAQVLETWSSENDNTIPLNPPSSTIETETVHSAPSISDLQHSTSTASAHITTSEGLPLITSISTVDSNADLSLSTQHVDTSFAETASSSIAIASSASLAANSCSTSVLPSGSISPSNNPSSNSALPGVSIASDIPQDTSKSKPPFLSRPDAIIEASSLTNPPSDLHLHEADHTNPELTERPSSPLEMDTSIKLEEEENVIRLVSDNGNQATEPANLSQSIKSMDVSNHSIESAEAKQPMESTHSDQPIKTAYTVQAIESDNRQPVESMDSREPETSIILDDDIDEDDNANTSKQRIEISDTETETENELDDEENTENRVEEEENIIIKVLTPLQSQALGLPLGRYIYRPGELNETYLPRRYRSTLILKRCQSKGVKKARVEVQTTPATTQEIVRCPEGGEDGVDHTAPDASSPTPVEDQSVPECITDESIHSGHYLEVLSETGGVSDLVIESTSGRLFHRTTGLQIGLVDESGALVTGAVLQPQEYSTYTSENAVQPSHDASYTSENAVQPSHDASYTSDNAVQPSHDASYTSENAVKTDLESSNVTEPSVIQMVREDQVVDLQDGGADKRGEMSHGNQEFIDIGEMFPGISLTQLDADTYIIEKPDGTRYQVESGPDGMTIDTLQAILALDSG